MRNLVKEQNIYPDKRSHHHSMNSNNFKLINLLAQIQLKTIIIQDTEYLWDMYQALNHETYNLYRDSRKTLFFVI